MKSKLTAIALSGLMLISSTNSLATENSGEKLKKTIQESTELLSQYANLKARYRARSKEHYKQNGFWKNFLKFNLLFTSQLGKSLINLDNAAWAVKKEQTKTEKKLAKMVCPPSNLDRTTVLGVICGAMLACQKPIIEVMNHSIDSTRDYLVNLFSKMKSESVKAPDFVVDLINFQNWFFGEPNTEEFIAKNNFNKAIDLVKKNSETMKIRSKKSFLVLCSIGLGIGATWFITKMVNRLKTSEAEQKDTLNTLLANKNNLLEKRIQELEQLLLRV